MTQDKREYLSKEKLQYDLLAEQKRPIPMLAFVLPFMTLVFVLLTWLFYAMSPEAWYFWGFFVVFAFAFGYSWIASVVGAVTVSRLLKKGEFRVEIDYVRKIDSDDPTAAEIFSSVLDWLVFFSRGAIWTFMARGESKRYIYFSDKRRVPASDHTRSFAGVGDPFYLVVLNNRRGRIVRIYNCKTYRLDEG